MALVASVFRRAALPPGLARLALLPDALARLHAVGVEHGPVPLLRELHASQTLEVDVGQEEAMEHLQAVWAEASAHAKRWETWRRDRSAWLSNLRSACRALRESDKGVTQQEGQGSSAGAATSSGSSSSSRAGGRRSSSRSSSGGGSSSSSNARMYGREPKREAASEARPPRRARLGIHLQSRPAQPVPRTGGRYVWGEVGRGKSMLMDLLSFCLSSSGASAGVVVRRQHFHDFMLDVHQRLHQFRQSGNPSYAVVAVAEEIATAGGAPLVLCLDEFQITHIADAVILRSFFATLLQNGALAVLTSNRPPEELYKEGLNHMIYMPPFLQLLQQRMEVVCLSSNIDYRERKQQEAAREARPAASEAKQAVADDARTSGHDFLVSSSGSFDADSALRTAFESAAGLVLQAAEPCHLPVAWGRKVACTAFREGVALFSFEDLCGRPLSADDYLAMIGKAGVHTLAISGIPRLTLDMHNEARRFTNLVDCLYENQCRLLCSAALPPDELMEDMVLLSNVQLMVEPAMGIAGSERSLRKHGDVTFEVSEASPCRPDTFATAEADAECGTSGAAEIINALKMAKLASAESAEGSHGIPPDLVGSDASVSPDGVAGVMSAALVSLQESGFAAKRCISRLKEMDTPAYRTAHRLKWSERS